MSTDRQPHLNGAYYGPSIPPPSKTYHRPGRGSSSCCCCNPFSCLLNCICTCICQILITILITLGILIFVLWLVFRPNTVKFYATDASLTEFSLDNNTLRYNLALNLTVRNPNKRISIYYDTIQANAYYEGQRFKTVDLQPFHQGKKNTTNLNAEFVGQNMVILGGSQLNNYNRDKSSGVYEIDVKLRLRIRLKFGIVKSTRVKPKIDCDLKIPLSGSNNNGAVFVSKRCDFDWR